MSLAQRSLLNGSKAIRAQVLQQQRRTAATAHAAADPSENASEGFRSILWPVSALAIIATVITYRQSARKNAHATNPLETTEEGYPAEAEDTNKPFLTRYLAYHFPRTEVWQERNEKHLAHIVQKSQDKLLMQDAELPRMRRRRYQGSFEQASPHSIGVGSQTDISDAKINLEVRPNLPPVPQEGHH